MTIRSYRLGLLLAVAPWPAAAAERTEDMLRQLDLLEDYGQGYRRKGGLAPLNELFARSKADVERVVDDESRHRLPRLALVHVQGVGVRRYLLRERPRQFAEFLSLLSVPNQPAEPDARLFQAERAFGSLDEWQTEWEAWLAVELANDPDPPEDEEKPEAASEETAE